MAKPHWCLNLPDPPRCSTRFGLCRVLFSGNRGARQRLLCRLHAVMTLAILLSASPRLAAQSSPAIEHPRIDWADALRTHRHVEDWLREAMSDAHGGDVEPMLRHDVSGLIVTLRMHGLVVGQGQWTVDLSLADPPAGVGEFGEAVDLATGARQAALQALGGLRQRIAADFPERNAPPPADDALGQGRDSAIQERLAAMVPQLTVDLQIARRLERVSIPVTALEDGVLQHFAAGYHGLVLLRQHVEDRTASAWLWPGEALARNFPPRVQVVSLVVKLDLKPGAVAAVGRTGGPALYRFEVIHVVRPGVDEPVTRLTRGNVPVLAESVSLRTLEAMALRLSDFLVRRQNPGGPMAGSYEPTSDRFDPPEASLVDQALAAYALARWLQLDTADAARRLATQQAVDVATQFLGRQLLLSNDLPAMALTIAALVEAPHLADKKALRDDLADRLRRRQNEDGSFRVAAATDAAPLRKPEQTLVFWSLVRLYEQTRDAQTAAAIMAAATHLAETGPVSDLSQLPWMALAKLRLEQLRAAGAEQVGQLADRIDLTSAAGPLLLKQVRRQPELGPADVVGGFDLTSERFSPGPPEPDWRTAHALLFLATSLRNTAMLNRAALGLSDVELTMRCSLAARFLAQLMFDEPACYYVRSRGDVLGGVRQNLWQNQVGIAPAAMTLLAVSELQQMLETAAGTVPNPELAPPGTGESQTP